MVVSATGLELVAMGDERFGKSSSVGDDLLSVGLPLGLRNLEKSSSDGSNGLQEGLTQQHPPNVSGELHLRYYGDHPGKQGKQHR